MTEKVFYETDDNVQICALVHRVGEFAKGNVVLAHGITVDKDEDPDSETGVGVFAELAKRLVEEQFNVLRFDFRGHGESSGSEEDMTVSGELLDLKASMTYIREQFPLQTAIVAASFGALSAVMYAEDKRNIPCMVLWNPVLDLRRTFIEPELPWAKASFNEAGYESLEKQGYLMLDDFFRLGRPLIAEMETLDLRDKFKKLRAPSLVLHGSEDTYVPYAVAKEFCSMNSNCQFVTVEGSEHGFGQRMHRDFVLDQTVEWILRFMG